MKARGVAAAVRRVQGRGMKHMERILLAYSGGLDTTRSPFAWLARAVRRRGIAVTLDLGQGRELARRPRAGARRRRRPRPRPRRPRRVRARVHPAGAAGRRALRGSLSAGHRARPSAHRQQLVEIARMEGATAIAHGCTGKDNDQVRLELDSRARPVARVIAPARVWSMTRPRRSSTRGRAACRCRDHDRQPLQHRHEPLGPLDRAAACSRIPGSSRPRTSTR